MDKIKMTKEILENSKEGIIFKGEVEDSVNGININTTGKILKFVVTRGYVADWTVYFESCWEGMTYEEVKSYGDKVSQDCLLKIIDANEEVWEMYRR